MSISPECRAATIWAAAAVALADATRRIGSGSIAVCMVRRPVASEK